MLKKTYFLEGLCCPVCASKIEKRVSALDGLSGVLVDFASQRLTVETQENAFASGVTENITSIIKGLEPSVVLREGSYAPGEKSLALQAGAGAGEWFRRATLVLGALLFIAGVVLERFFTQYGPFVCFAVFLASYILVGGEVLVKAVKNIVKGDFFDENFLMGVATIGAFAIGEFPEGAAVMIFYRVGEAFQDYAVGRSRRSISALMDIRPDYANLKKAGGLERVSPEAVNIGDVIVVKAGEKIPLDGVVVEGFAALDVSALTGEALPKDVEKGCEVLSGSINKSGLLTIRVNKIFGESTVSKILNLVQNASEKKSVTENFITKFARYYTPAVVFAAVAIAVIPPLALSGANFAQADFSGWINRALVFLVVSCPCALVISIPLSFFGGIGASSANGVLIKGSNYLEALSSVETVVFDKTGTLTKGAFNVTKIIPQNGFDSGSLLYLAAAAESNSNHPAARSIVKAYGKETNDEEIKDYEEFSGKGVRVKVGGKTAAAGNSRFLQELNVDFPEPRETGTAVHIALDGVYAGCVIISDEIKPDSKKAVKDLRDAGVKKIAMFTGDAKPVAEAIGAEIGVDVVYSELLPHQKVECLEALEKERSKGGKIVFVGDGINDAPVLARSDIGVAMGGAGSDAAIEAADVVLMTDEPSKVAAAIKIARRTRVIVWQNIIFALSVKGVILIAGAAGLASMWAAVFGDVGVALIAVLNAVRVMKK
ncbi:MAG: cadmium-translocating P-type ATPase [Spirochaetaceae bacterium]|jgi:Cd2+/Zn2+-exporting ATPase|nr:cadmium-translocating P-type ATPase [Spirochaetaceae bacterium]